MKKRSKKYNPLKSAQVINEHVLKGCAISYFANDEISDQDIILTDLNGVKLNVTRNIANAITDFPYRWSIMLGVFCIEKGLKTCKFELVNFKERYLQSELVNILNDKHQEFINKQKDKNVNMTGAGWIASPVGRDFSEDEAGIIFEKINAF